MGNASTRGEIYNNTPYTFHYSSVGREGVQTVHGHSTAEYDTYCDELCFRYGDHSDWDLRCSGCCSFTIRESGDRKEFELIHNASDSIVDRCPNFGRIDEEKRERERRRQEEERRRQEEERRRQEEEKRRQTELEHQRKIQKQIEKENEALRKNLSEAHNKLQLEQYLKTLEHHQQHSHVLHQLVEDDAHHIERDEVGLEHQVTAAMSI